MNRAMKKIEETRFGIAECEANLATSDQAMNNAKEVLDKGRQLKEQAQSRKGKENKNLSKEIIAHHKDDELENAIYVMGQANKAIDEIRGMQEKLIKWRPLLRQSLKQQEEELQRQEQLVKIQKRIKMLKLGMLVALALLSALTANYIASRLAIKANISNTEMRIMQFYRKHNPSKVDEVPNILAKYRGDDNDGNGNGDNENLSTLVDKLEKKYGDYDFFSPWERRINNINQHDKKKTGYSQMVKRSWKKSITGRAFDGWVQSVKSGWGNVRHNLLFVYDMSAWLVRTVMKQSLFGIIYTCQTVSSLLQIGYSNVRRNTRAIYDLTKNSTKFLRDMWSLALETTMRELFGLYYQEEHAEDGTFRRIFEASTFVFAVCISWILGNLGFRIGAGDIQLFGG